MKRYSALIIDDERLARYSLIKKLRNFSEIDIVGEASGIAPAMKAIETLNPDLLFLDIQLSDGNGFDLLDKIDYSGKIIFVTAYDEYAFRAFEINAQDYLLKPISAERLKNAINRLKSEDRKESFTAFTKLKYDDRIMIELKNSIHFLKIDNIVLINASKSYTIITDKIGKKYLICRSMREWESRLPEEHFCRVHRNSIVNFNFIEKTEKSGNSVIINIVGIPDPVVVSRGYYKLMKSRYFFR
jgi:two-component system, LytTR family, response regulator